MFDVCGGKCSLTVHVPYSSVQLGTGMARHPKLDDHFHFPIFNMILIVRYFKLPVQPKNLLVLNELESGYTYSIVLCSVQQYHQTGILILQYRVEES